MLGFLPGASLLVGFLDHGALTIGLRCVSSLVLRWTRRIRDDPDVAKILVSEQFGFAEDHTTSFSRDELHQHGPRSCAREDSKALTSFNVGKGFRDALCFEHCS